MSDLQPGRDLDAMVAEKVMGWRDVMIAVRGENGEHSFVAGIAPGGRWPTKAPTYSTSISAAWEVVEKMREDRWHYSIESFRDEIGCVFGRAGDDDDGVLWVQHQGMGESAPHAIALAALRAVGAIP